MKDYVDADVLGTEGTSLEKTFLHANVETLLGVANVLDDGFSSRLRKGQATSVLYPKECFSICDIFVRTHGGQTEYALSTRLFCEASNGEITWSERRSPFTDAMALAREREERKQREGKHQSSHQRPPTPDPNRTHSIASNEISCSIINSTNISFAKRSGAT